MKNYIIGILAVAVPSVPGEKEYLESFVSSFYERAYSMFLGRK